MLKWVTQFRKADVQTKLFILYVAVFGLVLIATTIYCYARLALGPYKTPPYN